MVGFDPFSAYVVRVVRYDALKRDHIPRPDVVAPLSQVVQRTTRALNVDQFILKFLQNKHSLGDGRGPRLISNCGNSRWLHHHLPGVRRDPFGIGIVMKDTYKAGGRTVLFLVQQQSRRASATAVTVAFRARI